MLIVLNEATAMCCGKPSGQCNCGQHAATTNQPIVQVNNGKQEPLPRTDWDAVFNSVSPLGSAPQQRQSAPPTTNSGRKQEPLPRFDWSEAYNSMSPLGK